MQTGDHGTEVDIKEELGTGVGKKTEIGRYHNGVETSERKKLVACLASIFGYFDYKW